MGNSASFTNIVSTPSCTLIEVNLDQDIPGNFGGYYNLSIDGVNVPGSIETTYAGLPIVETIGPIFCCGQCYNQDSCATGDFRTVVNNLTACAAIFGNSSNAIEVPGLLPLNGTEIIELQFLQSYEGDIFIMDQFGDGMSWGPAAPVWALGISDSEYITL